MENDDIIKENDQESQSLPERRPIRRGSRLDFGFPQPIILIGLFLVLVVLQVISSWKILNLEYERRALKSDIEHFSKLKIEEKDLETNIKSLNKTYSNLVKKAQVKEKDLVQLKKEQETAEKIIRKAKLIKEIDDEISPLMTSLKEKIKKETENLSQVIRNKTEEVNQVSMIPLNKSIRSLENAADKISNTSNDTKDTISKLKNLIDNSLKGSAEDLKENVISFNGSVLAMNEMKSSVTQIDREISKLISNADRSVNRFEETNQLYKSSISISNQELLSLINSAKTNHSDITKTWQKFANDLSTTATHFQEIARILDDLKNSNNSLQRLVEKDLKGTLKGVEERYNSLESFNKKALSIDISQLERHITTQSTDMKNLSRKIRKIEKSIKGFEQLEDKANQLNDLETKAETKFNRLIKQLDETEEKLSKLNGLIRAKETELSKKIF